MEQIPLFPLNLFLLPGEEMPLHIFEPRYRQLFAEAENSELQFGLPCRDAQTKRELVSICEWSETMKRYPTGESDVMVKCVALGELNQFYDQAVQKLYPAGDVTRLKLESIDSLATGELKAAFQQFVNLKFGNKADTLEVCSPSILAVACSVGLSTKDKLVLAQLKSSEKQEAYMLRMLRFVNFLLLQETKAENGMLLN